MTLRLPGVTTPLASANGFSDKLCGIPLAWRPKAVPRPKSKSSKVHDHRRCHVTVEYAPTLTAVRSLPKKFGLDRFALRAGLRCAARINKSHGRTGACSLVRREPDQLRPRGVMNGAGKPSSSQPIHFQVFESNRTVMSRQETRQLMGMIGALPGNFRCFYSQPFLRLYSALRSPLAPREGTLTLSVGLCSGFLEPRRLEYLPVARGDKAIDTQVQSDKARGFGQFKWCLYRENDVPFPGSARDSRSSHLCVFREGTMPNRLDLPWHTNNTNSPVADNQAIADPECRSVKAGCWSKTREAVAAFEKTCEGSIYSPKNLLKRSVGPSGIIGICDAQSLDFRGLRRETQAFCASPPSLNPLLYSSVVEAAKVFQHFTQGRALMSIGSQPVPERAESHTTDSMASNDLMQERIAIMEGISDTTRAILYLALAETLIPWCKTTDDLNRWWREEGERRAEYGIVKGSQEFDRLVAMCAERKQAISVFSAD